ncbi:trigger factor [Thermanaerovibrio acidaminovorans]|uniref:Trigger factor n=1 Tax=Thermanaerovibrio acidaminovorans (strain ATCC 49978 / DSM 6589 / Su883) TaxID=525903 RepID=D1BA84_THEAS|nr:trigger factor [Thermanaerovibrio acidaminovorans]ACZ19187.1 trigger factor [Thermanaerovibrio acidaminovorans DSM 6589]
MKSEIVSQEKNTLVIKAVVDAETFSKTVSNAVRELSNKVNIKGFRKGHVPRKTLEMFLGKGAIYDEAVEKLLPKLMGDIIQEYDLTLMEDPKVKLGQVQDGSALEVEFTFSLRPEVKFPELSSVTAKRPVFKVTDEMVEEEIRRILEANATHEPVTEDRPITSEDVVEVLYSSWILDGEDLGEKLEDSQVSKIELFNPSIRTDIVDALVGKSVGDDVSVDIQVDPAYNNPKVAGKMVRYAMSVRGILKVVVPELTDQMAEKVSQGECKTAEELRSAIREAMEKSFERRAQEAVRESALEELCAACQVDIPEDMLQRERDHMLVHEKQRVTQQLKKEWDQYLKEMETDEAAFAAKMEERAREIIKRELVLWTLADREGIDVSPEDLDGEIRKMSMSVGVDESKFRSFLASNRQRLDEMVSSIRKRKTMDWLVSAVKVENFDTDAKADA